MEFLTDDVLKKNMISISVPIEVHDILMDNASKMPASIFMRYMLNTTSYEEFESANKRALIKDSGYSVATYLNNAEYERLKDFSDKLGYKSVNRMVKQFIMVLYRSDYKLRVREQAKNLSFRVEPSFKKAIERIKNRVNPDITLSKFIIYILSMDVEDAHKYLNGKMYKTPRKDINSGTESITMKIPQKYVRRMTDVIGDLSASNIRKSIASRIIGC